MPATIPTGTVLFHGRTDNRVPDIPEWPAFDFEHGYLFCISPFHVISMQAKRDLRLLYFDRSSTAKMDDRAMESQDIFAETAAGQVLCGVGTYQRFMQVGKAISPGWIRPDGVPFVRLPYGLPS